MLKRARISAELAVVAAFFGFSGIVQTTSAIAQTAFYFLIAFSGLSLLLSLFEEKPEKLDNRVIGRQPVQPERVRMSTQPLHS